MPLVPKGRINFVYLYPDLLPEGAWMSEQGQTFRITLTLSFAIMLLDSYLLLPFSSTEPVLKKTVSEKKADKEVCTQLYFTRIWIPPASRMCMKVYTITKQLLVDIVKIPFLILLQPSKTNRWIQSFTPSSLTLCPIKNQWWLWGKW